MPIYPDHIGAEERSARRAINRTKRWRRNPSQTKPPSEGWLIARARPHLPFYLSAAPQGNKARIVHRPREQYVAVGDPGEPWYTLTVAVCGTETWHAVLREEAATVPKCECMSNRREPQPLTSAEAGA